MKYIPETAIDHIEKHIKENFNSQHEAAKAWGMGDSYLSAIVCGHRPIPKVILDVIGWEWRLVPKQEGGQQ